MVGERFYLDPSMRILLRDLTISPLRVLRRAGLPTDLFSRRSVELATAEYYCLWEAIDLEGAVDDRVLAVDIGRSISVELFSPPIFAALCSADLATAAQRLAHHKPLVGPLTIDVEAAETLTITCRWPAHTTPPELLAITELIFWVALARIATREHVRPTHIAVVDLPTHRPAVEAFLGTRIDKSDRYAISFSRADATRPFLTENEQMWRILAPDLRYRLHDLQTAATASDRVRAALLETLPAGGGTITAITDRLATSARTLQRQLTAEGTNFQTVLAQTREVLARHYLTNRDLRTTDIAYLLGYNDTNSFYRAFKTWTGTTPETLRAATAGANRSAERHSSLGPLPEGASARSSLLSVALRYGAAGPSCVAHACGDFNTARSSYGCDSRW